ncbi:hypothetical protein [Parasphingopyxis marina]|uniref:Sulfotransferase family protein n=1 Tax=Parasphingopyxis marina TaxID=2761622 RepID=A0A842HQL3_9SPHN|nr:hypothetical protein [Parasphingopyxis marina]MBC2776028.1 hypothetical protein [Parasphingopyxis marina]
MYVNDTILARAHEPRSLMLFIHSQRTGGSNTLRWLRTHFGDERSYTSRTVDDFRHWRQIEDLHTLDSFDLYGGFSRFIERDIFDRPIYAMANVRHPFYRIASLYGMSRGHQTHWLHEVSLKHSFEDYYRIGSEAKPDYFHNVTTRRLGGQPDFDAAKTIIEKYFGLVALTNYLPEATRVLVDTLGWDDAPMEATPAPPDHIHYARYDDSPVRDEIVANNREDLRLFEFINGLNGFGTD